MTAVDGLQARWRARSLRFQLAAIIALVGLLLVALNAALLGVLFNRYVIDRDGTALGRTAASLSRCSSSGVLVTLFTNQPSSGSMVQAVLGPTQNHHLLVVSSTGNVRYASPMAPALRSALLANLLQDLALHRLPHSGTPAWQLTSDEILVDERFSCSAAPAHTTSTSPASLSGALLVAEDRSVAESDWRRLVRLMVLAGLAVTTIGALAALFLGKSMTRSIRAVTRTARAIAAGDLRRRVSPNGPAELNEMSIAFNRMVEEVVRQRRIERDLLANISHELASPLGLIRGYVEALTDDVLRTADERRAALQSLQLETARLERLTGDLLDLALLETGQVSIVEEEVPVTELLRGLQQRLAPVMQQAAVTLLVESSPNLPNLLTDGQRLEQVLVNLLNNAVRHTPPGGTIMLAAGRDGDGIAITVADSGTGIPAEELPRIWERFYQVQKDRDQRGSETHVGLGLAICRSTVTLLQGTIAVCSTPGTGTTFTIWLPLLGQRAREQTAGTPPSSGALTSSAASPPRSVRS